MSDLSDAIVRERLRRGWSQQQLAAVASAAGHAVLTQATLTAVEGSGHHADPTTMFEIIRVLGLVRHPAARVLRGW